MKIGLGTVQFGLNYGISNHIGMPTITNAHKILDYALLNGVDLIDTAALYGQSEFVLGQYNQLKQFKLVTKTVQFKTQEISKSEAQHLKQVFEQSLELLKQSSTYGLMIHHADDLLATGGGWLFEMMQNLKLNGLVKKIGVSVYNHFQVDAILQNFDIDLIQLPVNVLDQRLLYSGTLSKLKRNKVEIHARSIFLQGSLLMSLQQLPPHFSSVKYLLEEYQNILQRNNLTQLEGCLLFVKSIPEIDYVILGVTCVEELEEILKSSRISPFEQIDWSRYKVDDEKIINPANWRA